LISSNAEIKVNEISEIRDYVTKKDGTYADKVDVAFFVSNTDIAGFKDNVSKKQTDAHGMVIVTLLAKSKGIVTVKAVVKMNEEIIEDNANIKVI
jgi:hypothetical protein